MFLCSYVPMFLCSYAPMLLCSYAPMPLPIYLALYIAMLALVLTIQVHAAASLTDVMREIGAAFQRRTGIAVAFNFAGSNTIARQIESGAPGDVFVSAD